MKKPPKIDINAEEVKALLDRVKSTVSPEDYKIIEGMTDTLTLLSQAVTTKNTSIKRLLQMIFGSKTEKTKKTPKKKDSKGAKKKKKGNGRNGADAYTGANKEKITHSKLKHCDPCPDCEDGRLYRQLTPGVIVRITGSAPLQATVYELEKLRCNICGNVFTADLPAKLGIKKYDATAAAMLAVLRYGSGLPLNRIAKLQAGMGIPIAPSTQWDVTEDLANKIHPAFTELIKYGAQGDVLHNDDSPMKVQDLIAENLDKDNPPSRKGIFTTGIMSIVDDRKIALFFTGRKHAGENMAQLLLKRQNSLDPPIQMCDALSRNFSEDFKTILAHCLTHGRRNFVNVAEDFPDECQYVLETIGEVYHNDDITKKEGMTPGQRWQFHLANSASLMEELHSWLKKQFNDKKVEPNSSLGQAIKYMLKHWQELTLFLRVEKAPLDNNICEQALKMAILHRKNSLFYKTEHGANVGDLFMSLIHTCNLSKINPLDYLTELQKNTTSVFKNPSQWLPWNYQKNLVASVL